MSYAKFGSGGSDVYVFGNVDGHLVCCACWFAADFEGERWSDWTTQTAGPAYVIGEPLRRLPSATYLEMLAHLERHRTAGHHVPDLTMSRLQREHSEAIEYEMEQ